MKLYRYLVVLIVIVVAVSVAFAAERSTKPVLQKAPAQAKIVKAQLNKDIIFAAGTGLKGTLTLKSAIPTEMKSMTCGDINIYVGTYTTPTVPAGTIAIPTFEEVASRQATGDITKGSCTYQVFPLPAGVAYNILVNVLPGKFACDSAWVVNSTGAKVTFTKGQMAVRNFDLTPTCVHVK